MWGRGFQIILSFWLLGQSLVLGQISFEDHQKALELNNQASVLIEAENYLVAENLLIKAIVLDSTIRTSYVNLNYALSRQKKYPLATDYLKKATAIFSSDDELWYYLGNAYTRQEMISKALEAYEKAIHFSKINGEDFELVYAYYLNKANCLMKLKKYSEAIEVYGIALHFNPNGANIYFNRGMAYLMLKDKKQAKADWTKARELGIELAGEYIEKYCE
ncbi:tetratricopeptide repeat protein [Marinilabiliaceae bacterium JC017]|nr:tetratricopeptide repeat protein [Marinilabiliaceae bacterium JC017]